MTEQFLRQLLAPKPQRPPSRRIQPRDGNGELLDPADIAFSDSGGSQPLRYQLVGGDGVYQGGIFPTLPQVTNPVLLQPQQGQQSLIAGTHGPEEDAIFAQPTQGQVGIDEGFQFTKKPPLLEFTRRDYKYPTVPNAPTLSPNPLRDVAGERRKTGRDALKASILGLLIGGGEGAVAAGTGYMGGAKSALDQDYAQRVQAVTNQNAMASGQYKQDLDRFGMEMDIEKQKQLADDKDQAIVRSTNADRMREWNSGETNRLRAFNNSVAQKGAAEVRRIMERRAATGEKIADSNIQGVLSMINYRKEMADLNGEALDLKAILGFMESDLGNKKLEEAIRSNKADEARMTKHYEDMAAEGKEANRLRGLAIAASADKEGREKPLSKSKMDEINAELSKAEATIATMENPGKKPNLRDDPTGFALWSEGRDAKKISAGEYRKYLNSRAEQVGKVYDEKTRTYILKADLPPQYTPQGSFPPGSYQTPSRKIGTGVPQPGAKTAAPPKKPLDKAAIDKMTTKEKMNHFLGQ